MIRTILAVSFIALFLIFTIPVLLVFKLLYKRYPAQIDAISLAMVKWAMKGILFLSGTTVIAIGEENIPKDRPVMYAGNHASFFDIMITYARVPGLTGFVSKISMAKFPILNHWMRRVHCLFLDRENIKEGLKTILEAIEKVKSGISIFIFPEGTRNHTPDTLMDFKEGSFKIADKSGCPIIPVTLVNTSEIFESHLPRVKKTTVVIEYGTPIYMDTLDKEAKKHVGAYVQSIIEETYKKNKAAYF